MIGGAQFEGPRSDALAWVASASRELEFDRAVAPYVDAAAVLSTFKLEFLRPVGEEDPDARDDALIELTNRCRAVGNPQLDMWQLQESTRRIALSRLGSREAMRAARAVNRPEATDTVQQGIDLLIDSDRVPDLGGLSLEQLIGLERAVLWMEGVLSPLPPKSELTACIERERQLAPMRRLAGDGFVDRETYRNDLADYVGTLPPATAWHGLRRGFKYVAYLIDKRPPLHLYGPGGIGKSALLARFILDHTNAEQNPHPLPFVYLDFDRASLDPKDAQTILEESIRQLLVQFPWVSDELASLEGEARESVARTDSVEAAKSGHFDSQNNLVRRFCSLLDVIAARNDQPVLMLLDTLEEAEYQGLSAMLVTWNLLEDLLRRVDRLRVVTAGRSRLPDHLAREPIELPGLTEESAQELVIRRTAKDPHGPITADDAAEIVRIVGTVPLSLQLAARVVLNEGVAGLKDAVSRRSLFKRIKAEQQQGMLYRRILNHVRTHEPALERVANPGLILRRITRDLIVEVLAGPCDLELTADRDAQYLFDKLALEVGLVDPYREPNALWHLPAVRRIMLPELVATLGAVAIDIHRAAADYYHGRPGAVERAEEIYHRLWLGEEGPELDALWSPDLEPYLRGAFDELAPGPRIWLGDKLGIELDVELREQASYEIWERQAGQRARTLLANGLVSEALEAVRERDRPPMPSPLFAIEADALKLLGDLEGAVRILNEGLVLAERSGDRRATLPLVLRLAFIHEVEGRLDFAWGRAFEAGEVAQSIADWLEWLSAAAAMLRIGRKAEARGWDQDSARRRHQVVEQRAFESFLKSIRDMMLAGLQHSEVRAALRTRPALLTEIIAELGQQDVKLLTETVSLLGITPDDLVALRRHIEQSDDTGRQSKEWIYRLSTSRGVGAQVAEIVPEFPDFFVQRLRESVEHALRQAVGSAKRPATRGRALSRSDKEELVQQIGDKFDLRDLSLLVLDALDVRLESIAGPGWPAQRIVLEVINHAERQGNLDRLLQSMIRSRPRDVDLQRVLGAYSSR